MDLEGSLPHSQEPVRSEINTAHSPSHFVKIHFNIILPSTTGSSKWFPSPWFPNQNPVCTSPVARISTCPAHLILLGFGEEYRA